MDKVCRLRILDALIDFGGLLLRVSESVLALTAGLMVTFWSAVMLLNTLRFERGTSQIIE